jgi:hypothetical protein
MQLIDNGQARFIQYAEGYTRAKAKKETPPQLCELCE